MDKLNKEIINTMDDLNCNKKMKEFLEKILEYELEQYNSGNPDSKVISGNKYKELIADYAK
ncbi:hypothetical protein [uncultured Methanobrevibacter sp.]|uniref:hypothetical protein n=1 Tax=uncultured Methanobrevibacter sp. TaxID=253161 RepID=UPI0025FDC43E|nr:hypothetical protein [uncultured Methanobrevibacter sp.]